MWVKRSHNLALLTKFTGQKQNRSRDKQNRKLLNWQKRIIVRDTILACPDYLKPFEIHTDASHSQLRTVISQNKKTNCFL